jgi:YD repeat-containing protein
LLALGNETLYEYDGNGNLTQKTDADGYVTEYSYDALNLLERVEYDGGKEAQFAYDKNGALTAMMDWNGTARFSLDALGRVTSAVDHNEREATYSYDAVDNVATDA